MEQRIGTFEGRVTDGTNSGQSQAQGLEKEEEEWMNSATTLSPPNNERAAAKKAVDVACWACRKRKAKCTGERPACASCVRRKAECEYEHEEGLTRVGSLKMKLQDTMTRSADLEYLFHQLRTRPDQESALLLAIIRLGADVSKIVAQLRTAPETLLGAESSTDLTFLVAQNDPSSSISPPSDQPSGSAWNMFN